MSFQLRPSDGRFKLRLRTFRPSAVVIISVLLSSASFAMMPTTIKASSSSGILSQNENCIPLEVGNPIENEIAGSAVHCYVITATADQFVHLVIKQLGVNVVLFLTKPNGQNVLPFINKAIGLFGEESVSFLAESSGKYRVVIRPRVEGSASGRYEIKLAEVRAINTGDERRFSAERAFAQGEWQFYNVATQEALQNAVSQYAEALSHWRAVSDSQGEAVALNRLAQTHLAMGDREKALSFGKEALLVWRAAGDRRMEGEMLTSIATILRGQGKFAAAIKYLEDALLAARERGERREEAQYLVQISSLYQALGEREITIKYINDALTVLRAMGDHRYEAFTLASAARAYFAWDLENEALASEAQALKILQLAGDRSGEALVLRSISAFRQNSGKFTEALELVLRALDIDRALGNRRSEVEALRSAAQICSRMGDQSRALEFLKEALLLTRALADRRLEASALLEMGLSYSWIGEYQSSFNHFRQALTLYQALQDRAGEGTVLMDVGFVYDMLGDREKALDYYNQALKLSKGMRDGVGEATTLTAIGFLYASLGDGKKALEFLNQALPLSRKAGYRRMEGAALSSIGLALDSLGQKQKALESLEQGLTILREAGDRVFESATLHRMGLIHESLGERDKALEYLTRAVSVSRSVADRLGEANALYGMALAERNRGNLTAARNQIEAALGVIESLRTKSASQAVRANFLASKRDYYVFNTDLLMELHRQHPAEGYDAAAFQASERGRARSLLDTLTDARSTIRSGADSALLDRERSVRERLNIIERRRLELFNRDQTEAKSAVAESELRQLLTEYQEIEAQIRAGSSRYAALTQPQPLSLREIQQQVLDSDTLLLEYALGDKRSYLWAVTPGSVTTYELPGRAELVEAARRVNNILIQRSLKVNGETVQQRSARIAVADARYWSAAADLSQIVLGPVAAQLGTKRLLIVADGPLQSVPFAALPYPRVSSQSSSTIDQTETNTPLIVEHEIVSLPSASVLSVLRKETSGRKIAPKALAVIADPVFDESDERVRRSGTDRVGRQANGPGQQDSAKIRGEELAGYPRADSAIRIETLENDLTRGLRDVGASDRGAISRLPSSRQEAQAILSLAPPLETFKALDFKASRATAMSPDLSQYRIVHFATHGILDDKHPELSGVLLSLVDEQGRSQDGLLQLLDIYNLNLPAELVVLSACQTGLGKEVGGEGLVGLTRGFMYAGAKRVVASLWKVNDRATAELMKWFYQGMLREKRLRPAEALRAAQVEMWKQKRWQSPYYWAAFVLQGEWR